MTNSRDTFSSGSKSVTPMIENPLALLVDGLIGGFAAGIENSCATIEGGLRIDEMEKCGHYERWREDLERVHDLRLHFLRWRPAMYKTFVGPGRYDWSWVDDFMAEARRLDIDVIVDL